jgi:hypothetical protein
MKSSKAPGKRATGPTGRRIAEARAANVSGALADLDAVWQAMPRRWLVEIVDSRDRREPWGKFQTADAAAHAARQLRRLGFIAVVVEP